MINVWKNQYISECFSNQADRLTGQQMPKLVAHQHPSRRGLLKHKAGKIGSYSLNCAPIAIIKLKTKEMTKSLNNSFGLLTITLSNLVQLVKLESMHMIQIVGPDLDRKSHKIIYMYIILLTHSITAYFGNNICFPCATRQDLTFPVIQGSILTNVLPFLAKVTPDTYSLYHTQTSLLANTPCTTAAVIDSSQHYFRVNLAWHLVQYTTPQGQAGWWLDRPRPPPPPALPHIYHIHHTRYTPPPWGLGTHPPQHGSTSSDMAHTIRAKSLLD